ncbi:monosaccharide ABC transporter substrate-binding protein, CUT2 family [Asanoa ishikariensis]|uniref:Monosaccharide ABC transporter substrate-binding protein, CUT2 family n=1 Tax=Asanoa ishikariensis TaxID=137265 RepID=A0A1H3UAQ7_9ACTN|nr:sugar ABC transporter substrate-binding protein [Asanoa ishikariensis]SDZ59512.1 monosaccharide ABC transporter substrate-binding protein, CUT2 family [Asanoa ishikariensis]
MRRTISVAAAALLGLSTLAACGDKGDAGASSDAKLVYGIPSPLSTEPGEHNINLGITCYAEKNGGKVITLDANLDVNKQISDFDSLLAQGANVLAFLPLDQKAFTAPFGRAKDANAIVVELYNAKTTAPGGVYEDSREAGADATKYVAEKLPNGAKALLIGGPPIPAVTERMEGFKENAAANKITILEQADNLKDNVNDARALADDLLTKHPDVQVIFGFNDNSAVGAGLAAKARGMKDVIIFGINGTPEGIAAVKDGTITATYDADQWGMGFKAAELGAKLKKDGGTATPIASEFKRWDASNAAEWVPAEQRCAAAK